MNVKSLFSLGFIAGSFACAGFVQAQADGVPLYEQSAGANKEQQKRIVAQAVKLKEAGKLMGLETVEEQLQSPKPAKVELPAVAGEKLAPHDVAKRARAAQFQVGYVYLCKKCDDWHVNFAAGYAIAPGIVATCEHVVAPNKQSMKEGYLVVANEKDEVFPVKVILAKSSRMDAAVLQIDGPTPTMLALNHNISPGDDAYCHSSPLGQEGLFTDGIVNRFYWRNGNRSGTDNDLDSLRHLRMTVSTDWAPGSSGAAVLDALGNAIGHVSTISSMSSNKEKSTQIILHEAVPAKAVRALVESMKDAPPAESAPATITTLEHE